MWIKRRKILFITGLGGKKTVDSRGKSAEVQNEKEINEKNVNTELNRVLSKHTHIYIYLYI